MKSFISFFEIPATNFERAVKFYENVFGITLSVFDCGYEKMAFFPQENGKNIGAISWAEDFRPSSDGVLISLSCGEINYTACCIEKNGGKIIIPKTQIEADKAGYFATFTDSEGNRIGLWSEK